MSVVWHVLFPCYSFLSYEQVWCSALWPFFSVFFLRDLMFP
jgi:hypothetical protein